MEYRATMALMLCGQYKSNGDCVEIEVISDFPVKKKTCQQRGSRRKRDYVTM